MRISTAALHHRLIRDLHARLVQFDRAQERAASGQRLRRLSDDPVAGAQVMRADRDLRALTQYRRAIGTVRTRLDTEEAVLDQITDLLTRAKELGASQGNASASAATRTATALEVDRLLEQVVALGNTRVGGEYLFGGTETGTPPFPTGGGYAGNTTPRVVAIGEEINVSLGHHGQELLVDSGVIQVLTDLRDAMQADDPDGIRDTLAALDTAFDEVQRLVADVGARLRRLDLTVTQHDAAELSTLVRRSDLQDVSVEEATIELMAIQTALQAALLSANRLLTTSLTEYLR